jgi:hypothetical protein
LLAKSIDELGAIQRERLNRVAVVAEPEELATEEVARRCDHCRNRSIILPDEMPSVAAVAFMKTYYGRNGVSRPDSDAGQNRT